MGNRDHTLVTIQVSGLGSLQKYSVRVIGHIMAAFFHTSTILSGYWVSVMWSLVLDHIIKLMYIPKESNPSDSGGILRNEI